MVVVMDRILVVDDDTAFLRIVSKALSLGGYTVGTATNGREALAQLQHGRPGVILLDLSMPVMDGRAFAQELNQRLDAPPIILVTAAPDGPQQAEEIGAVDCVSKPLDPMALLGVIARARQTLLATT